MQLPLFDDNDAPDKAKVTALSGVAASIARQGVLDGIYSASKGLRLAHEVLQSIDADSELVLSHARSLKIYADVLCALLDRVEQFGKSNDKKSVVFYVPDNGRRRG